MDLKAHYALHRRAITKTLLVMKFTAIILLSACLTASATGFGQKVTLSEKNARLENVFKTVREQTGYEFLFTYEMLKKATPVTLDLKSVELEDALAALFKEQPLTYRIIEKTVVVKPKAEESPKENIPPPLTDVKGRLVNENDEPVLGATVTVKGTKIATSTNSNGEFILSNIDPNATLVFSSTNIEPIEIKLNGRTDLNLVAKNKISKLDEIQVIAYGTNTQRNQVGSVSKIKAEEIASQPVSNPLAALQGRVPGLVVTQSSGLPGSSFKVQIRGQNTLTANPNVNPRPYDSPLIVIDGVPFAPQNKNINQFSSLASPGAASAYNNAYGGISPLSSINPADIESIEVLRDADATAIYGSRAANGVMLITTKRGNDGATNFNLTIDMGQSSISKSRIKMMNTKEYLAMRKEAFANDGITPSLIDAPDLVVYDSTRYTDWVDYFLSGTAKTTNINGTLSGGSKNTKFILGAGYYKETYIYPGDFSYQRGSFRGSINHTSTNQKFKVDFSTSFSFDKNNSSRNSLLLEAFSLSPNYPELLDGSGNLNWQYKGVTLDNPLAYLKQKYEMKVKTFLASGVLSYEIWKGLTLKSNIGYNSQNSNENSFIPRASLNPYTGGVSMAEYGISENSTWNIEPQLDFNKSIGKGKLSLLAGLTFQQSTGIATRIQGSNYSNDALLSSPQAAATTTSSRSSNIYKYSGVFGRANYIYDRKYILNLTVRRDGSSRFGPGRQFGNFGSAGAGWIFSEEKFVKQYLSALSYGKLKISYGTTGGDAIGDYQFQSYWRAIPYPYNSIVGYWPTNVFQPDYSWTVNKKFQAGIELGFFKDKLLASLEWYQNRCGNQLVSYALPIQTGFSSVTQNFPGLVENKGFEVQLTSENIKSKEFRWVTTANISFPKNILLSFPGIAGTSYDFYYKVGESTSVLNRFKYLGVNPTTGVFEFQSKNGGVTSTPNGQDYFVIGNLDPKFYGGLRNTFSFKGFQLDLFIEFKKQLGINMLGQVYQQLPGTVPKNQPRDLVNRWQKPGDMAAYQKLTTMVFGNPPANANYLFNTSSGHYSDASFVRGKNLSLSYSVPQKALKILRIQALSFYANCQNIFTITNYKGLDPETQSFYSLPPLKTIVAGLQFNF